MSSAKPRSDRVSWFIAWFLTFALHGAGILVFRNFAPPASSSTTNVPESVQM